MSSFLYDLNSHQTIGVVKRDWPDAGMLLPSDEDPITIRLQFEMLMKDHRLRFYSIPDESYAEALKLFHQGKELVLEMHRFNPKEIDKSRVEREERLRSTGRQHSSQKLSPEIKNKVRDMAKAGFSQSKIAKRLKISQSSVSNILKTLRNGDSRASEASESKG